MNKFFHNYPTCPNCLAPIIDFTKVISNDVNNNSFKCEHCGAHFHNRFLDKTFNESLFWSIDLNCIEESYLSFFDNKINGKFLITWPWDEVKFSPILAADYLIKNPNKRIIMVDKLLEQEDSIFEYPSCDNLFNHLYYIDSDDFTRDCYDKNLINEENIFENRKKFYCDVSIVEDNLPFYKNLSGKNVTFFQKHIRMEVDYEENKLTKFRKEMIKKIESLYSDSSIHSIKIVHENKLPKLIDEYGLLKLRFNVDEGIESHVVLNDSFKDCYGKILPNISKFTKVSDCISSIAIDDTFKLKEDYSGYNLIFLDDSMDFGKLMRFISKVGADITIFNRADLFFEKLIIFNKGLEFHNFLSNSNNNALLFSTFKDDRNLYRIGVESSILNKYDIIPHTWDFDEITDNLKPNGEMVSLGASNFQDIKLSNHIPVEYVEVNQLNEIENTFSSIYEFYNHNAQIKKFLKDLIKTPLFLSGYFKDKKVFRKHNFTFESFFASIYALDEELGIEIDSKFDSVYDYNLGNSNPILNEILLIIDNFDVKYNDKILFVVDNRETKGLKELIELNISDEDLLNHLEYYTWDDLVDYDFNEHTDYYIVSTREPYINFKLNDVDLRKIYFVGSTSVIEDMKIEMTKRLTDEGTKPIFVFDEGQDNVPKLLMDSISKIKNFPQPIEFNRSSLNSKLNYDEEPKRNWVVPISTSDNAHNKYNTNLESDDDVVLVISKSGEGMFLPLKNSIYIKNKLGSVDEVKTSKDSCKKLINKEIVLDSEGFYTSFRLLFFKFVIESENEVPIFHGRFQWNTFKDIIMDTFEWLRILKKVHDDYYSKRITLLGSKFSFAYDISKLRLHARDPGYIAKLWLGSPVCLETSEGNIPIYENEHPKTREDLIKLYEWLNNNFESINLSDDDAEKSYYAAVTLQKIRGDFLRKRKQNVRYGYLKLYHQFEQIVDRILLNADSFEVAYADVVKLNEDIIPYKVVLDYKKYLK